MGNPVLKLKEMSKKQNNTRDEKHQKKLDICIDQVYIDDVYKDDLYKHGLYIK